MNQRFSIALDGPSGAGKSTIARALAQRLGITYLDTGAMYRAVALYVLNAGAQPSAKDQVIPLLDEIDIEIRFTDAGQRVLLNGQDVSEAIRENPVSPAASQVAAIPEVRERLVAMQREMASQRSVVMDGRDIGTAVLPDATLKIFLTASAHERARRRFEELRQKGEEVEFEALQRQMLERDYNDSHRAASPLRRAEDAVKLDSTGMDIEQVVEAAEALLREKIGG
ncbi:MAG TPA: (d)CMP kinase [Candidatus Faecaligallichristensenella faecipullorum]|nr:(d)CMP kinase [Candidatus Faecaligallichristensenella faecipullorum]